MHFFIHSYPLLVAQKVKNLPAMRETWVQSLDREDPLEQEMQPSPVFLPGESHGERSLVGYSPWGHKELDMPNTHNDPTHKIDFTGKDCEQSRKREVHREPC